MRKFWVGVLVGLLVGVLLTTASLGLAAQPIRLVVNGREVKADPPPQMIGGRVFVPIRFVAEALGAKVEWDGNNQVVIISQGQTPTSSSALPSWLSQEDVDAIHKAWRSISDALTKPVYQDGKLKELVPFQEMDAATLKEKYNALTKQLAETRSWLPSSPKLYTLQDALMQVMDSELALLHAYVAKENTELWSRLQPSLPSYYRVFRTRVDALRREFNSLGLTIYAQAVTKQFEWLLTWEG